MKSQMIFRGSLKKALMLLVISMGFVVLGAWATTEQPLLGWLCVAFFGLGIPASLLMMRPNSTYLKLDADGIDIVSMSRHCRLKWSDVDAFRMSSIRGAKMIAIDYSAQYTKQKAARAAGSALAGMEGAIADHYTAPLEQVLQTLNEWKAVRCNTMPQSEARDVPASSGAVSTRRWAPTLGGMVPAFPWPLLLLKLAALLSYCGGPLVLAEWLKSHIDKDAAFAITFVPTVGLVFGVYSLWEAMPDRWDRAMVLFGALAAAALLGMNVFAIFELANSPARADEGLIRLGMIVGVVFIGFYAHASHKFFNSRRSAA